MFEKLVLYRPELIFKGPVPTRAQSDKLCDQIEALTLAFSVSEPVESFDSPGCCVVYLTFVGTSSVKHAKEYSRTIADVVAARTDLVPFACKAGYVVPYDAWRKSRGSKPPVPWQGPSEREWWRA